MDFDKFPTAEPFFSIDKTAPKSAFENEDPSFVSAETEDESELAMGEKHIPDRSRVIRYYRMRQVSAPSDESITAPFPDRKKPVPFVPCLTTVSSFVALTSKQKEYFLYFCACMEEDEKVPCSFPYVQLYLCRLLHLCLPLHDFFTRLLRVWNLYRKEFPYTDKLCSDFLSDYCLYHKIKPPYPLLSELFTRRDFSVRPFLLGPFLFDYLFSEDHKMNRDERDLVLRTLTAQSFRKSKAYRMHPLFASAAEDAVAKAFDRGLFNRNELNGSLFRIQIPSQVKTKRKLFSALPKDEVPDTELCLCHVPLLHDENIRSRCDELLRYLENRIRQILKLKNTLSRIHISSEHRSFLESILAEYLSLAPKEDEASSDSADQEPILQSKKREIVVDFSEGTKIEEESWQLTQSLTEHYTESGEESVVIGSRDDEFDSRYETQIRTLEQMSLGNGDFWEFAASLTETEDTFLRILIHQGKEKARRFALSCGQFAEALTLSCNEKAQNTVEDVVIDPTGEIYPDYRDGLTEVFPPIKGE